MLLPLNIAVFFVVVPLAQMHLAPQTLENLWRGILRLIFDFHLGEPPFFMAGRYWFVLYCIYKSPFYH